MSGWRGARLAPAVLLAPALLPFALFVLYPLAASVALSFQDWDGIGPRRWVGLANYVELAGDPVFRTALANNLTWLLLNLLAPVFGLAIALWINQKLRGMRLARALFFVPFVISPVVVGLVFAWALSGRFGLLGALGLGAASPLDSEHGAILAVIGAGLWPQTAYCAILYLAGLTTLRPEQLDAGRIDGAGGWTLLRRVVLPQLRPVTFIAVMVSIVSALRGFDLVVIMTGGGPYDSSTVLGYYMYEQTFLSSRYGYAAAIATVLFALTSGCVFAILRRLLRRESA